MEKAADVRSRAIRHASWVGIAGNGTLAILKIGAGWISGSMAVLGDGIDTLSDVLTYIITLITARIISRPPDLRYPYGYKKAETISTKVLSFIIFFAGAQLLISTASRVIEGSQREMPATLALWITIISIVAKAALAAYQFHIGRKHNSQMIVANARNMRNDIVISLSVLTGLVFTFLLQMPLLDTLTGLLVSIWIMYVAFKIFKESNIELMDGVPDSNLYLKVIKSVDETNGADNPHRIRIRKLAELYLVALDIEVDPEMPVKKAHDIARNVEQRLRENIPNLYDVLVHIEPSGNIEPDEVFGVSEQTLNGKKPIR